MFFSQVEFLEFNTTILSIQYKHHKLECILEVPYTGDFRNAVSIVSNYAGVNWQLKAKKETLKSKINYRC